MQHPKYCTKNLAVFKFDIATYRNMVAKRMQHVVPNNVARCCVEMLRAFGQALILKLKLLTHHIFMPNVQKYKQLDASPILISNTKCSFNLSLSISHQLIINTYPVQYRFDLQCGKSASTVFRMSLQRKRPVVFWPVDTTPPF